MNKRIIISVVVAVALTFIWFVVVKNYTDGRAPGEGKLSAAPESGVVEEEAVSSVPEVSEGTGKEENQINKEMNIYHLVTLKTNLGDIVFKTYDNDAPKTVANFLTLAGKGFYDGVIFHRVIDGFMIQGGDPTGTGRGGPGYAFEDELDPVTESYKKGYVKGTVAMANAGPNTNGSQFFIMVADVPLPHAYSIFGSVVFGQDVADRISLVERDRSDRPLSPVVINKVTIEEVKE